MTRDRISFGLGIAFSFAPWIALGIVVCCHYWLYGTSGL
jgi:hypothetical protein